MKKITIQKLVPTFVDSRGEIYNLLQKVGRIAWITFKKGSIRGNHYHKNSTQYALVMKGEIEITTFHVDSPNEKEVVLVTEKVMIIIPPGYVHIFKANTEAEIFDMMDKSVSITGDEDTFKYE